MYFLLLYMLLTTDLKHAASAPSVDNADDDDFDDWTEDDDDMIVSFNKFLL